MRSWKHEVLDGTAWPIGGVAALISPDFLCLCRGAAGFGGKAAVQSMKARRDSGIFVAAECRQHSVDDMIAIGRQLLDIKSRLPHGHFGPWLREQSGLNQQCAPVYAACS